MWTVSLTQSQRVPAMSRLSANLTSMGSLTRRTATGQATGQVRTWAGASMLSYLMYISSLTSKYLFFSYSLLFPCAGPPSYPRCRCPRLAVILEVKLLCQTAQQLLLTCIGSEGLLHGNGICRVIFTTRPRQATGVTLAGSTLLLANSPTDQSHVHGCLSVNSGNPVLAIPTLRCLCPWA
jgi:hypothetical protein